MSQLLQMRQRIKAIETIQKITHAMQLISMSTHVRLREKKTRIEEYQLALQSIFKKVIAQSSSWHNPIFFPTQPIDAHPLIILIGSQKGLCGTFNINLFSKFEKDIQRGRFPHASIISIGKRATDYLNKKIPTLPIPLQLIHSFNESSSSLASVIVSAIMNTITHAQPSYSQVIVYSNYSATFFTQRQQTVILIPTDLQSQPDEFEHQEEFIWEDSPTTILDALATHYLQASLYDIVIKSLLAEQAARFISMDNATRNAESLRDLMKLHYNKIRQAKITKELTELSVSFQQDLSS